VISTVGDDELGREAIDRLARQHRLNFEAVQILADRPTGAVDVRLVEGQPTYTFRPDVAWDFLQPTPAAVQMAREADAVVFGTLAQRNQVSSNAIHSLLAATPLDCLRVFDVNLRPPFCDHSVLERSLAVATVLKLNDTELPVVLEAIRVQAEEHFALRLFHDWPQLKAVALTRGMHGSAIYTPETVAGHSLPAERVVVQDTVGAGDAFTAALVAGMLRGHALEAIHKQAVAAAAFVCSQAGATPRLPEELSTCGENIDRH
jgi:fructokinase